MPDRSEHALRQLVHRGVIRPGATPVPDGNRDRRPELSRLRWRGEAADGQPILLTMGHDVVRLGERQSALAAALPKLVVPPVWVDETGPVPVLAEPWFAGETLEAILQRDATLPPRLVESFRELVAYLESAEESSTVEARDLEYAAWSERIAALPVWPATVATDLRNRVLPRLGLAFADRPPARRWTNGDFTSGNLLYSDTAGFRLIDAEHAASTHFFAEDSARFFALSPGVRARPHLFSSLRPPGPALQLFFWLQQLRLECATNQPAYLTERLPRRFAVLRSLIECALDLPLPDWPTSAVKIHFHLEGAEWRPTAMHDVHFRGWCTLPDSGPLTSIVACTALEERNAAALAQRPDVQAHFGGAPTALDAGFDLPVRVLPEERIVLAAKTGEGELVPFHAIVARDLPGRDASYSGYAEWARTRDPVPAAPTVVEHGPLFSVLLPVYRTPLRLLQACVQSVLAQHFGRWELCIVDDSDTPGEWRTYLSRIAATDPRIRVNYRANRGGIAQATNEALAMSRGEFIALLDHDDELRPHALLEFARALARIPSTDVLYSDEDKISEDGSPLICALKPAWSPEFFRGVMYVGHLLAVRRTLALGTGGFDSHYDGVQDFEFMLRVSERTQRILHVPQILYHWRHWPSSSSADGNVKGDMDRLQCEAVQAHLRRCGDPRIAQPFGAHRVALVAAEPPAFVTHRFVREPLAAFAEISLTDAPVIIAVAQGIDLPDSDASQLAALAARPDSAFVSPTLFDHAGLVIEAGRTLATDPPVGLMDGFSRMADGYNGALRCNREVSLVSPRCFAFRRELVRDLRSSNWVDASAELAERGFRHRICAVARATASRLPSPHPAVRSQRNDPYFNPHFDPVHGDYRLGGV